jgi:putative tryptophan/tyrosine transport system substrate-binding protein
MPISHLHRPIGLAALAVATVLTLAQDQPAQAPERRIAFVGALEEASDPTFQKFKAALATAWPSSSRMPAFDYFSASASDDEERFEAAIQAAAATRPSVLVLPTGATAAAARRQGVGAPVVFSSFTDLVGVGVVDSLNRPGRQATGVWLGDTLDLKRLELLKLAFPRTRIVAYLTDTPWISAEKAAQLATEAKGTLGLTLIFRNADTIDEVDRLMTSSEADAYDAWYIPGNYIAYLAEAQIIAHLKRLRRPAIHTTEHEVAQGALMAYAHDTQFVYGALADLTRRVALGEDAGSIPVQRPYRYTLSVRIEPDAPWARIEPSVVRRADRVHRP